MSGTIEYQQRILQIICRSFFWLLIAGILCQFAVTLHRWSILVDQKQEDIDYDERRYQAQCQDAQHIVDLNFHEHCKEWNKGRQRSASVVAVVHLLMEWQLCDAEKGGCRGVMGLFIGAAIVMLGILYLLRRAPRMFDEYVHRCDAHDVSQFMCNHSGSGMKNKFL